MEFIWSKMRPFCAPRPCGAGARNARLGGEDISIGQNLRRLRKKARLSQQDVSIKLDLLGLSTSREIVSRMERGQYSIRVSVLRALKDIYKVDSYDEFFKDL